MSGSNGAGAGPRRRDYLARRRPTSSDRAEHWLWWAWPLAVDLADGKADLPRFVAKMVAVAVVVVAFVGIVVGALSAWAWWYVSGDAARALRFGVVLTVATWLGVAAWMLSVLLQRFAPRWWAQRKVRAVWTVEATWRVLTWWRTPVAATTQVQRLRARTAEAAELLPRMQEDRAARTWDLRRVDWTRPGAVRDAQRVVLGAYERAWTVRHRDRPMPPLPRVVEGRRTARGVALELEWPGGGHAGHLEDLAAELASVWHVPAETGLVIDRDGRPGNRAGLSLNYVDPFPVRARSPLLEDDDADAG